MGEMDEEKRTTGEGTVEGGGAVWLQAKQEKERRAEGELFF
jgi:hypothetical protein